MQSLGVPEPILSDWNRVIERCSETPEAKLHTHTQYWGFYVLESKILLTKKIGEATSRYIPHYLFWRATSQVFDHHIFSTCDYS